MRIVGQKLCEKIETELGDYVPFKFRCHTKAEGASLYWRTGNLESTLLEVEVNVSDGQVVGASLLLTGSVNNGLPELRVPESSFVGLPVVCTSDWPDDRFLDQIKPFKVFIDESRLLVLLSSSDAERVLVASNVTFGVCADKSLSWMLVSGLNSDQLEGLVG